MRSKIFYTIIMLVVVFSCQKEESGNNNRIIISANDDSSTLKSTLNSTDYATDWVAGDKIGVYCSAATPAGVNSEYTATTTGHTSGFTGSLSWGTGLHTFYAYYPRPTGGATPAATAVPIALSATQTEAAGVGAYDFLYATPFSLTPVLLPNPAMVDLKFKHAFTLLELVITPSAGSNGRTLKTITLTTSNPDYFAFTTSTFNITTGVFATPGAGGGNRLESVSLTVNPVVLATGIPTKHFILIYGAGVGTKSITITLSDQLNATIYSGPKAPPVAFALGSKYVVTLSGI